MSDLIDEYFQGSIESLINLSNSNNIKSKVLKIVDDIYQIISQGKKILIAGNGGSAADSQHFAAELVVRYKKERRALPAIALTTDSSILTAASNDYSFEDIFARQVDAIGNKNDMLFLFSTSGNSLNVIKAAKIAKKKEIKTVLFTGEKKSLYENLFDIELNVPSKITAYIQECHLTLIHLICQLIDKMYSKDAFDY
tara:strand:+ start:37065 stop:37655 length:591 start_codon:yes stop_codon:yes gene_type:complete